MSSFWPICMANMLQRQLRMASIESHEHECWRDKFSTIVQCIYESPLSKFLIHVCSFNNAVKIEWKVRSIHIDQMIAVRIIIEHNGKICHKEIISEVGTERLLKNWCKSTKKPERQISFRSRNNCRARGQTGLDNQLNMQLPYACETLFQRMYISRDCAMMSWYWFQLFVEATTRPGLCVLGHMLNVAVLCPPRPSG